jgi:hypothetical protein
MSIWRRLLLESPRNKPASLSLGYRTNAVICELRNVRMKPGNLILSQVTVVKELVMLLILYAGTAN